MKIGVFNVAFPYKNPLTNEIISETGVGGGVENIVYMLTVKMAEQGHELHVFSSSENKKESTETYEKIVVYRYKKNFEIGTSPVSLNLLFKPLMMKRDLDIVHAHMGNLPAPLVAYWYAKKIKKPFVITYHGEYVYGFGGPVRTIGVFLYHLYFANKLLKNADAIIVLSENVINESKLLTKYRDKIKVIPNGINLEEFEISLSKEKCREHLNLPQDKNIILFVGSLTHIKAPDVLLNAMKLVIDKIPETYLVLVGSGQMQTELEIQAKKLGIQDKIKFVGFIRDQLSKIFYYKAADVFVLPSHSECFPVVLLEASACGLPLVVSNLESLKAIVKDQYNGLFTITGDENDLAKKLIHLLQHKEERIKLGENAKEHVKNFSMKRIAEETEKVYQELIRK